MNTWTLHEALAHNPLRGEQDAYLEFRVHPDTSPALLQQAGFHPGVGPSPLGVLFPVNGGAGIRVFPDATLPVGHVMLRGSLMWTFEFALTDEG